LSLGGVASADLFEIFSHQRIVLCVEVLLRCRTRRESSLDGQNGLLVKRCEYDTTSSYGVRHELTLVLSGRGCDQVFGGEVILSIDFGEVRASLNSELGNWAALGLKRRNTYEKLVRMC
jgi:hypothetical protein